jgi:hypothetical protein
VSFLRRLLGGGEPEPRTPVDPAPGVTAEELEQRHERDLLRAESARLDELQQRQLRYADRAWTPPAQGGERRSDDEDPQPSG